MKKSHRSIFLKEIKEAFPELVANINSEYGLLHLEMHAFLEFVQKQIERKNTEKVVLAFQLIERHFKYGNNALVNAIEVSFLEHLDLEKGSWALKIMPTSLVAPYKQLRQYHDI
jgi:hypothetical protein